MLRRDVVEAAAKKRFHIYPTVRVDEALEVLTRMDAGSLDSQGEHPQGTVNWQVQARLKEFVRLSQQFGDKAMRSVVGDRTRRES